MAVLLAVRHLRGFRATLAFPLFLLTAFAGQVPTTNSQQLAANFQEAERLFWLDNWVKARDLYVTCEGAYAKTDPARALMSKFSRLRADAETKLSYTKVSLAIAADLETDTARNHPEVRLRGLLVKATADLSVRDPTLSGREWQEVRELAHALQEFGWEERAEAELGIVAYLRGETQQAVTDNQEAFDSAKKINDVAGMIRDLSLRGVGLLERNNPENAIRYFDQALELARTHSDARFPLMAYMGKAQALEMIGDDRGSGELLVQAKRFVDNVGMTVYKADLLIALGSRAAKHGNLAEAETDFEQAATSAKEIGYAAPLRRCHFSPD
jgi:tetratricopeptide (TPR) repeat protein